MMSGTHADRHAIMHLVMSGDCVLLLLQCCCFFLLIVVKLSIWEDFVSLSHLIAVHVRVVISLLVVGMGAGD